MLKNIPAILPPNLLKILMEMGHGDEIVIADGNFPSERCGARVVRCDGHGVPEVLAAVLKLMPLDAYAEKSVYLMQLVEGDNADTSIWKTFEKIIAKEETAEIGYLERFEFYERAKKAYAVVATGETATYANILLKKGVVVNGEKE